ncbi:Uncharacterised protein [Streptococcus pseudopneumoniae]|nr:Uncharacterised protein [Streptococcus pseudopneumoniae]COO24606.1 Uncharacterised protein [Streptococcus pseudopneumoniae]
MKIKNLDLNDAIFLSYTQDRKLLWHDELLVDNNGQIIYDKEFSAILSNKNWNYVIDELVRTIEYIVSKTVKDVKKVYLYSGSFGSILGLLLSARFSHNLGGHICVSPLIDLSNQIKKTSGMERKWFTDKFSTTEITEMFSDKVWKKNLPYKTFIMQSPRDKVLDFYYMKSTLNNYKCFEIDELPINGHGPETEFELDILNQSVLEKMNKLFVD